MSDYLSWHVGMKVVFVGYPAPPRILHGDKEIKRVPFLTIGEVYEILDITIRKRLQIGKWKGPSIFVGCVDPTYGRVWHHHSGFRPVQPRATDISMFTAMLTGSKQKVPAA